MGTVQDFGNEQEGERWVIDLGRSRSEHLAKRYFSVSIFARLFRTPEHAMSTVSYQERHIGDKAETSAMLKAVGVSSMKK